MTHTKNISRDDSTGYGAVVTHKGHVWEGRIAIRDGIVHLDGRLRLRRYVDGEEVETYRERAYRSVPLREVKRIAWTTPPSTIYSYGVLSAEERGAQVG